MLMRLRFPPVKASGWTALLHNLHVGIKPLPTATQPQQFTLLSNPPSWAIYPSEYCALTSRLTHNSPKQDKAKVTSVSL